MHTASTLGPGDAVIAVDVQNDFCPGGALAVPGGDTIIAELNHWLATAKAVGAEVIASRDWHPVAHCSFEAQGGPWPEHCVQSTPGADFHPALELPEGTVLVSKGTAFDRDAYSAFDGTGLGGYLRQRGVRRLWVGGLAQDVCVQETVRQACEEGFETHLITSATRPVTAEGDQQSLDAMRSAGALMEPAE